jgi:activator of 2-hydroxyglutaryl-CoA dehydratase
VKVIGGNELLKSAILRKTLILKDFPIIENYLYYSRYGKSLLSDSNEKRSVKTFLHVVSRVTKHREKSKNSYEQKKDFFFFINEERMWRRLLFWPQRYSQRFTDT